MLRLAESFYKAYEKKDIDGFAALWATQAPSLADRRKQMQKLFAGAGGIDLKRFGVRYIRVDGMQARVSVAVELVGAETIKDDLIINRGLIRRVLHCRNQNEEWKVWNEESAQEDFAARLVAAPTDEERRKMMAEERESLDQELPRLIIRLGNRYFSSRPPDYAQAIAIYHIAHSVALQVN